MDVLVQTLWAAPAMLGGMLLGRWSVLRRVPTGLLVLGFLGLAITIGIADARTFDLLDSYSGQGLVNGAFFIWLARYLTRRPKKEPLTRIIGAVVPASRAFEPRRYGYIIRNVDAEVSQ